MQMVEHECIFFFKYKKNMTKLPLTSCREQV